MLLAAPDDLQGGSTSGSDSLAQDRDDRNGLDRLGRNVKKLIQGIQQLRHLGIEDFNTLPKIVAVG